jgi:aminopeptidase N
MNKTWIIILFLGAQLAQAQTPDSVWQRSLKKFEQQNYLGVVEDMNALLKVIPGFANGLYNRGIAKLNLGDNEGACTDLLLARAAGSTENKQFVNFLCDPKYVRDLLLKQFYKNQKVYPELGYRPKYTRADTLRGALRPERSCFDVYFYDLKVKIMPKGRKIKGSNDIYFHVVQPSRTIQIDLFDTYAITEISWNGKNLPYRREFNAIFIDFPRPLQPGENLVIHIAYNGKPLNAPNPPWDGGFVWKKDKDKRLWLGVACEQLGASSWWPTKDHLSDKPDSMLITLEVPAGYQAVSNGNLRKVTPHVDKGFDAFTWFVSYPINNYNVTFYVGKYVAFSDTLIDGNDTVRMDYNVLDYNLDVARKHFMQTRDVIDFYDKAFGLYPFRRDGFGLVESPYEGMEHQTAIAYGNGYDNNNGNEYRNRIYDYIIVHEAAHEWWGNCVAAEDMADIWIHEGFATYAELMFLEHRFGKEEYLYELSDKCKYIFNVWPVVQNRDVNENAFASNDVYTKGAMMLHCLRSSINNDSTFFDMIRGFWTKYRFHTVTSYDFINFVNAYTHTDYTPFFRKFLFETSLPVLAYVYKHDGDNMVLKYRWTGVEDGFSMPFGITNDKKNAMRLVGTTQWQEITLPDSEWFNFFNLYTGYAGCPDNAFTYYRTSCENH